jgi:hypothetical protein
MTPETQAKIEHALEEVRMELIAAYENFPDFRSAHEGVAIIDEEYEEFKNAAYWPHKQLDKYGNLKFDAEEDEATQLAAMAVRYMVDICYNEEAPR